jgi:hypothetical protein
VSPLVVLPLLIVVGAAVAAMCSLRQLGRQVVLLQQAVDALVDVRHHVGALRAEAAAAGVTTRVGPNP